jgi:AcrR family transcriptional regulator
VVTTSRIDEARLRPAGRATRESIETAARSMFREHGYDATSVRAIAAEAGIDPALVIRHFGSKEDLFLHVVETAPGRLDVLDGPVETLGQRIVSHLLSDEGSEVRRLFVALLEAAHHDKIRNELVERSQRTFIDPVAARLDGDHPELRMLLVGAQISGMLTSMFVWRDLAPSEDEAEFIATEYGAAIQRLLTP